ncbi:MAG: RNA-binding cell elongation regulator Jag/EloR [Ilumatobacteraceae bacterium]
MEWVETTAKSVDEAKEFALDQLGVAADDAEFEVLETPRPGLFGRIRGEARVRARIRPTPVRPKQERRRGRRSDGVATATSKSDAAPPTGQDGADAEDRDQRSGRSPRRRRSGGSSAAAAASAAAPEIERPNREQGRAGMTADNVSDDDQGNGSAQVDTERVREAAVEFVDGLTQAFGFDTTVDAVVDGTEIEVRVHGESLGLLIGPGGRTLLGIQDLARVAAQRRLGDHETRLRVDVAGYREKRRTALQSFATTVAEQVRESGVARALDAMPSADRKVLHDALADLDGVTSRSEGEEPNRRVVVTPA